VSFLSPLAFIFLGLAAPLVLLYFLKVRRQEQKVPALFLWEATPRDQQATALFQRLQKDPFLILQLLALVFLTLALSRPAVTVVGKGSEQAVLILDVSASMRATDVSPSRFREAQRQALALVDRLGPGALSMVMEAGPQPRVVVPFTRDRDEVRRGITQLRPHDLPNHLTEAIQTARALTAHEPQARVYVFTDGAFDPQIVAPANDPKVRWVSVGRRGKNIGITELSVRKSYYGAFDYQAFVSLANFSDERMTFPLRVRLDGNVVNEQVVTLEPQVRRSVIIPFTHQGGGVLKVEAEGEDDLDVDDSGYAVIPALRELRVLLVSRGNLFLEKALRSDPQVKLEVRASEGYQGGMEGHDVVVLDSVAPAKIGPGRFVLINTTPGDVPLELFGRMENPVILDWDRTHPVMRFVDFSKVATTDALRVRPLTAAKILVEGIGGPLLLLLEEPQRKIFFVAFDLFQTDLPLRVAFPLLLSNALRWLSPVGLEGTYYQAKSGTPLLLPVEHGVDTVTIVDPDGHERQVKVARGQVSVPSTEQVGLYRLALPRGSQPFAVNLVDAGESQTAPRPLPEPASDSGPGKEEVFLTQMELWGYFLAAALLCLVLEGILYWRRQTGGRLHWPARRVQRWALGIRGAMVILLVVSLAQPKAPRWVDRLNVFFLLDISDSVTLAAREQGFRFLQASVAGMREEDRAGLIVFGAEARIEAPLRARPVFDRPESSISGKATNVAQAVQLALASFPPGQANRMVLLSDGRENSGNTLASAQLARGQGADLHYVALGLTFPQEVVLDQLVLPSEVKFGEPFLLRVVAWSLRDTSGRLSLYRNGEFIGSQLVRLTQGKNVFTYRQSLESARVHVYQAHLEVEGDTIEENNRAIGLTAVRGKPLVLYAEKDRAQGTHLVSALRSQHIEVEQVDPDHIPKDLGGLQKYDAVVLSNISSLKLTKRQMESIRDYVKETGGGLLMLGGEESFGLGGYYRTPVEEALPVTMEVKQKVEIPSLAVMLIIDRSGSMAMSVENATKLDIAKEAAHLAVELLDDRNELGVMSFDTELSWAVPLGPIQDRAKIGHEIASIKSGGGTDGYPAIKEAYKALYDRQAVLKHVIFLSDGQMTRGDFADLIRRMAKDKVTVSAVAIGKDADVQLMYDIAKWGRGRFYYTDDLNTIPRIFTLETQLASKASLVEQPFRPILANESHELTQGIEWKQTPPLGGYVATSMKRTAQMLLMTHQEDPLLAVWRYGLGRTAAFTSDAKAKWGILWIRWRDFNRFWGQTARWLLRSTTRSDMTTTVERRDGWGVVTVDAVDPKGEFINFVDAQAGVVTPEKTRIALELQQVGPGRYRGLFPAQSEGVYLVGLAHRKDQKMVGSQLAGLVVPYSPELREIGVNSTFLDEISGVTGGGALAQPTDAFQLARGRSRLLVDLWPWLVGLVTLLLVPEIALRRAGAGGVRQVVQWIRRRGREAGP